MSSPTAQVYDICLHEFRHRHAWMGFIDADEFLVLRDRSLRLPSFLKVGARH
jgi:Glycosyltransferase family 92